MASTIVVTYLTQTGFLFSDLDSSSSPVRKRGRRVFFSYTCTQMAQVQLPLSLPDPAKLQILKKYISEHCSPSLLRIFVNNLLTIKAHCSLLTVPSLSILMLAFGCFGAKRSKPSTWFMKNSMHWHLFV